MWNCSIISRHLCIMIIFHVETVINSMCALLSGLWLALLTWTALHASWTSWRTWTTRPQSHRSTHRWSAASRLWWTTRKAEPMSSLILRASTLLPRAWPQKTSRLKWRCWKSWEPSVWCLEGTKKSCSPCCTTNASPARELAFKWVAASCSDRWSNF